MKREGATEERAGAEGGRGGARGQATIENWAGFGPRKGEDFTISFVFLLLFSILNSKFKQNSSFKFQIHVKSKLKY